MPCIKFLCVVALNVFTKGIQVYSSICQGEYVKSVMQMRAVLSQKYYEPRIPNIANFAKVSLFCALTYNSNIYS